ncbi:hypothetical protein [Silvanigrella sp.]|uniref:hypothetical protein n=1 Tax=Silvanigrella sp. TaxID=2024976 RepID=UPI0037CB7BC6
MRTLTPIVFLFSINCTSLADTPNASDTSGIDSIKGNVDTATSSANTAKETGNTVKEFIPKDSDNPNGKSSPNSPPPNSNPPNKPGGIFDRIFGRICSVQINTQREANNNSSILTEIVIIYKPELFSQISSITVKDWFTNTQTIKTLKKSNDMQIYRFEITPDSLQSSYLIDVNSSAVGAFLFNRLTNNLNTYPVQINPYKDLKVSFFNLGFNYLQDSEK